MNVRFLLSILSDILRNDGENILKILLVVAGFFVFLVLMIVIPVVIHERIPVTITKEQALWYYNAAREVTLMTQSPCDPGVYVDWQEVIAIDAVRYKQNFKKSSPKKAKALAEMFVEVVGECIHCVGEGENMVCTAYPVYRKLSIEEVMKKLEMSPREQKMVLSKYRVIDFNFLIGFKPEQGETAGNYEALYSGDMMWPVPGYHSISSPYGMRIHPIKKVATMHYGIDIPAPEGTLICAPADGKVISYKWSDAVGWTMVVDHGTDERGQRIITRYCHLDSNIAVVGQKVKKGEKIAMVGNTGYLSTGAHLHFEVQVNGVCRDPVEFFRKGR